MVQQCHLDIAKNYHKQKILASKSIIIVCINIINVIPVGIAIKIVRLSCKDQFPRMHCLGMYIDIVCLLYMVGDEAPKN